MDRANVRWPASLWAAVTPPGPELPELVGLVQSDVIVIGAGFTGLSTGLHLRETGVEVAIVAHKHRGDAFDSPAKLLTYRKTASRRH